MVAGELVVGLGGLLPARIVTTAVPDASWLSVTRRLAVWTPWLV